MQGKPHTIRLAIDNVLVLWRTIQKLCYASIFSSILANTKLFMKHLNQALVGGGPNVNQKKLCDRLSMFA